MEKQYSKIQVAGHISYKINNQEIPAIIVKNGKILKFLQPPPKGNKELMFYTLDVGMSLKIAMLFLENYTFSNFLCKSHHSRCFIRYATNCKNICSKMFFFNDIFIILEIFDHQNCKVIKKRKDIFHRNY